MGGMIPLGDASRRLRRWPIVTVLIILLNVYVFTRELIYGDAFVYYFSAIPVYIVAGNRWWTILTAMFMHGGWLHIIGNMIYLWAFGPEIEDAMGRWRFFCFYIIGGVAAMLGLAGFLELLFSRMITRITVRVILERQLTIGTLQLLVAGIAAYTQHLIVVSFAHSHRYSTVCFGLDTTRTNAGRSSLSRIL